MGCALSSVNHSNTAAYGAHAHKFKVGDMRFSFTMLIADIHNPPLIAGHSAEEIIMASGLAPLYDELRRMIFDTEVSISRRVTQKGKGRDTTGAPGLATGLNNAFKITLESAGWKPLPAPGGTSRTLIDWHKTVEARVAYSHKPGLGLEIQFGNNYQFNEDLKKLTEAFLSGQIEAGMVIVASDTLAKHKADRGAYFSDAKSKLDRHLGTFVAARALRIPPIMVIGIEQDQYNDTDDGTWEIVPVEFDEDEHGQKVTTPVDPLRWPPSGEASQDAADEPDDGSQDQA